MNTDILIRFADFDCAEDARAVVEMVDMLASWPGDEGQKLSDQVCQSLIARLRQIPGAFALLAICDEHPVGLAICFEGFSTFHARPLINIHDFLVRPEARRRKVGVKLLERIEEVARQRNCCRITLEVYESNEPARKLYEHCGFGTRGAGAAIQHFLTKQLDGSQIGGWPANTETTVQ